MQYVHYNNAILKTSLQAAFPKFNNDVFSSIGVTKLLDMVAVQHFVGDLNVGPYALAVMQSAKLDLMTHGKFLEGKRGQIDADASLFGSEDRSSSFEKGDIFVAAELWRDLPSAAKNVLEWIESPETGKKNTITIEVGLKPHLSTSRARLQHSDGSTIVISQPLFDTIKHYVQNSKEEPEYPYLFSVESGQKMSIWNDAPEDSLYVRALPGHAGL